MTILTVNTGSSSVRLALFEKTPKGLSCIDKIHDHSSENPAADLLNNFLQGRSQIIKAVSHRVVHGGATLTESCVIDEKVEKEIDRLSALAPLHNPVALKWIKACRDITGNDIPQIAVFDTAFFASMPDVSKIYALPRDLCNKHDIKRYGFHGIAHNAMLERIKKLRPDVGNKGKIISIQLGSGCSVTAVESERPVDTSMGFSPNEGLVMSTRSGDINPDMIFYLHHTGGLSINEIYRLLNKSSGLLGVSGLSDDMRELLESNEPDAKLAVELYCYRVRKYIGAYMAALGGVDCITFGGGVGEKSAFIRERILRGMQWCGIVIDSDKNNKVIGKEGYISSDQSNVFVIVVPVDESVVLAQEADNIIGRM
jgi:acetate kinase